jgi:hypothetical protein
MIAISREKIEDELIAKIECILSLRCSGTVIVHFVCSFVPSILTLLFSSTQTIQEK